MIAYNSFLAMLISCCSGDQWSRIHLPNQYAPIPLFLKYLCNTALWHYLSNENQRFKFFLTNEVKSLTTIGGPVLPLLSGEDGGAVL